MKFYEITNEDRELVAMALRVLEKNYDDGIYYHTVGAALRCKNGKVYLGVNCDGIHGSCAEFIAMGNAVSAGEREFDTIVAVHQQTLNNLLSPCGNCRQMMYEYYPDIRVIFNDDDGKMVKVCLRDILPFAWRPVEGAPSFKRRDEDLTNL